MGMPQTDSHWTAELVRALPDDGKRYELVSGELVVTQASARTRFSSPICSCCRPSAESPPLLLDLPALFAEAWGERVGSTG